MTYFISPYQRMAALRKAMESMMDDALADAPQSEREMILAVDVLSTDEGYEIMALVPGLEAQDLVIEILNNTVTMRGEFKSTGHENAKYLLCELPAGVFSRVISLPTAVDTARVEASIKNGVLALHLPKAEPHPPKTIQVRGG